jgi:MFS family permease
MGVHPGSRRALAVLCLASAAWAFTFGLGAPLASLWLKDAGLDNKLTGLNTSVYYLGIALAAPLVPGLMRRGCRHCMVAGMVLDGVTVSIFPWVGGLAWWFGLRFLCGVGTALCLIPMETQVNRDAPRERRARDFGFYATSVALGIGLGPLVGLPFYRESPRLAFAFGGLVTIAGVLLLCAWLPPASTTEPEQAGTSTLSWTESLFGLGTAWAQGFLEGGMVTFLSIYLLALGYGETAVSGLFASMFLGVILFQLPVAWLADRLGRLRLLVSCHAMVLLGLAALAWHTGPAGLAVWLFVVGACCAALYPLGLALLGERIAPAALASANAWYLASNCAGSLTGPILIGLAMDVFGSRAMFAAAAAAVLMALGLGAAARKSARPLAADLPAMACERAA